MIDELSLSLSLSLWKLVSLSHSPLITVHTYRHSLCLPENQPPVSLSHSSVDQILSSTWNLSSRQQSHSLIHALSLSLPLSLTICECALYDPYVIFWTNDGKIYNFWFFLPYEEWVVSNWSWGSRGQFEPATNTGKYPWTLEFLSPSFGCQLKSQESSKTKVGSCEFLEFP